LFIKDEISAKFIKIDSQNEKNQRTFLSRVKQMVHQIAVLGSGNGGCAVAYDYAAQGHQVRLFDFEQFSKNIKAVQESGGIHCEGELEGFQPMGSIGREIEKALDEADIIFVVEIILNIFLRMRNIKIFILEESHQLKFQIKKDFIIQINSLYNLLTSELNLFIYY